MVSFKTTRSDRSLISAIVDRAVKDGLVSGEWPVLMAELDLMAVHANGCRLRLADMIEADDKAFAADFTGISTNLDRMTGRLKDGYRPRFSVPDVVTA